MNEKMLPYLAIILSIVAISAAVAIQPESKIKVGSIDSKKLAKNSVTSNELANDAVTGKNIVDGTITDDDLNSTGISKIKDSCIETNHLTQSLQDKVNGTSGIADNSISSLKIKDYTIINDDIKNNTISNEKILDNSISDDDIGTDAVGNDELKDNSVDSDKIQDESIGSEDIGTDAVGNDELDDNSVNGDNIQDESVGTEDIEENAITEFWQKNPGLGPEYIDNTSEQSDFVNLTNATINITTGNNPVLFLFSGVFCNTNAMEPVQIMMFIDNEMITPTTRKGTSVQPSSTFTLSFNYIKTLSEGTHNVEVRWRAPDGLGEGQAFNRVLDIIEMKK